MSFGTKKMRQLERLTALAANTVMHVYDPVLGKDRYMLAADFLRGLGYPTWNSTDADAGLYDTGTRVTHAFRLWESLTDDNAEIPTEGSDWTEVSPTVTVQDRTLSINKTSHGFSVGDFLTIKEGDWELCGPNDISFARVEVETDADNVAVQLESELLDGFTGLTPFDTYWHGADGGYQTVNNGNPAFVAISATQAISYPVPASTIVSTSNASRREYPLLVIDTAASSGNVDLNIFNGYEDAIATIEFRVSAVKTVDGAKAYSRVVEASFHKDGTANPVLMDTVTNVHGPKTTGSSDLTTTISTSGVYVRFAFDSPTLDQYRITVWATISITQL